MISPRFFSPRSIAVVGASRDASKVGAQIFANLLQGFRGRVYPINPHAKKIMGVPVIASLEALPEVVDLAIIVLPAAVVPGILETCGQKGIRQVVIISGGFGELGKEGKARERVIADIAEKYAMTILGPNCLGFLIPRLGLNASFGPDLPAKGGIALFSQSGAMAVALIDRALEEHVGFSAIVSMGNKAVIDETALLRWAAEDPHTSVIALYLESIEGGKEFLEVAYTVSRTKPIILLKAGVTTLGSHAIASHTGKIAGDAKVLEAYARDRGIIQVHTEEELFLAMRVLTRYRSVKGKRLAVVTNAGGPGVLMADALDTGTLQLVRPSSRVKQLLRTGLPAHASVENPIDVLGDASSEAYAYALETMCASGEVDMVTVLLTPQTATDVLATAKALVQVQKKFPEIPVVVSFLGGRRVAEGISYLQQKGMLHCAFLDQAVYMLEILYLRTQLQRQVLERRVTGGTGMERLENILQRTSGVLSIVDTHKVMRAIGHPLLPMKQLYLREDIKQIPASYYPVVLKVDNTHVLHKTDVGGVALHLATPAAVEKSWKAMTKTVSVPYVIAEKMSTQTAQSLFVGCKRTEFGDVLVVGMGGIYAELFTEHCIIPAPFSEKRIARHLRNASFWKVITGYRGQVYDEGAALRVIAAIGVLFASQSAISVIDVNPLFVYHKGAKCIDVKITIGA